MPGISDWIEKAQKGWGRRRLSVWGRWFWRCPLDTKYRHRVGKRRWMTSKEEPSWSTGVRPVCGEGVLIL